MKLLRVLEAFCIFSALEHACGKSRGRLELVQVIHRHGDRTPFFPFPKHATPEEIRKEWPEGFQQLTKKGVSQMRELGKWLRKRYSGYLPQKYEWHDALAMTSSVEYAIQSSISVLRGLYPSLNTASAGCGDPQIVPVRTIPVQIKNIILVEPKILNCPRFELELEKFTEESPSYRQMAKEFEQVRQELVTILGNQTDEKLALYTFDYLNILEKQGKPTPPWVTPHIQKMRNLHFLWSLKKLTGSLGLKRLSSSMVQTAVSAVEQLNTNSNSDENSYTFGPPRALQMFQEQETAFWRNLLAERKRKFYLFTAHDFTLATFMDILGIFNQIQPPYAAAIIIEARRETTNSSRNSVEILYRNTTEREPFPLEIPGCGSPCQLERLKEILVPLIPKDYEKECQLQN